MIERPSNLPPQGNIPEKPIIPPQKTDTKSHAPKGFNNWFKNMPFTKMNWAKFTAQMFNTIISQVKQQEQRMRKALKKLKEQERE